MVVGGRVEKGAAVDGGVRGISGRTAVRIHTHDSSRAPALFAAALVMGFILWPGGAASGQNPPPPVVVDQGVLVLELGSVDRFVLYDTGGQEVSAQSITTQGCKVSLGTSPVLVALDPVPNTSSVGLFDDGIGVQTKGGGGGGGNGQPCGRADGPDEGLVLTLAGDLADLEITRAELDIEGKFNAEVIAELYDADGALVATASLPTGDKSDSGPDSTDGDNYRWEIDPGVPFHSIKLFNSASAPDGAFSLEGGADGTEVGSLGITGSAFTLVETFTGIIPCGDDTLTVGDGTITAQATFTRGDDDFVKGGGCTELIGYNLESTATANDQTVSFVFETEEAPSWFGTFTWAPEPAVVPVPATQVDGSDLQWCDGFSGIDTATGSPKPVLPSGESWCLIDQSSTLLGLDEIQVTQTIYGEADPSFIRPR
jgi:hypothetical protein